MRLDLLFLLLQEGLQLSDRPLGGGELLEREAGVVAHDDEAGVFFLVLLHDLDGILLLPGGIVLLARDAIEVQAEHGEPLAVVVAPRLRLGELAPEGLVRGEQVRQRVVHSLLRAGDVVAQRADVVQQRLRTAVDGLGRARDVHHAQALEFGQELLLVSVQEDEGVLGHLGDHRLASSSSA